MPDVLTLMWSVKLRSIWSLFDVKKKSKYHNLLVYRAIRKGCPFSFSAEFNLAHSAEMA